MDPDNSEILFGLLPVEIWRLILEFLRWDSQITLHSINLTCREFHWMVSPILFRVIHINFPNEWNTRAQGLSPTRDEKRTVTAEYHKWPAFLEQEVGENIYPHVQVLILTYGSTYNQHVHGDLISKLVKKLPNLDTIRWRGIPLRPFLLRDLSCRRRAPDFYFEGRSDELVGGHLPEGASCIRSLSITSISWGNFEPDINALRRVILSLPNLERLTLKHHPGQRIRPNGPRPIFHLPPGSTLPPLRILSFANFSFDSEQAAGWAECLQRRDLQHLGLDGTTQMHELIDCLSGYVSSLKSLAIRVSDSTTPTINSQIVKSLNGFLRQITELRAFTAHDLPKEALRFAVHYHGNHLRQLRFRHTRFPFRETVPGLEHAYASPFVTRPDYPGGDCLFSPDELRDLSAELPVVETLGIDLCFKGKVPYDFLSGIGCFPSLKCLELNTPVHEEWFPWPHSIRRTVKPFVDASMAEEAFRYVADLKESYQRTRGSKKGTAPWPRLEALNIKTGEWEPFLKEYRERYLEYLSIYACWREAGVPAKVHLFHLPCKSRGRVSMIEDSMYEEAMHSVGLLDSATAKFGPAI